MVSATDLISIQKQSFPTNEERLYQMIIHRKCPRLMTEPPIHGDWICRDAACLQSNRSTRWTCREEACGRSRFIKMCDCPDDPPCRIAAHWDDACGLTESDANKLRQVWRRDGKAPKWINFH